MAIHVVLPSPLSVTTSYFFSITAKKPWEQAMYTMIGTIMPAMPRQLRLTAAWISKIRHMAMSTTIIVDFSRILTVIAMAAKIK